MKFSIKDYFSKCDQIRRNLQIWSHLLKKYLMENFIFCVVQAEYMPCLWVEVLLCFLRKNLKVSIFIKMNHMQMIWEMGSTIKNQPFLLIVFCYIFRDGIMTKAKKQKQPSVFFETIKQNLSRALKQIHKLRRFRDRSISSGLRIFTGYCKTGK